jgi:hypothetical protein
MGAPLGNTNAANAKRWQAAIERAIASYPDVPADDGCNDLMKGLNKAAAKFVGDLMGEGGLNYFREFGDRLDGKPGQAIDLGSDPERPMIQKLIREIVRTKD